MDYKKIMLAIVASLSVVSCTIDDVQDRPVIEGVDSPVLSAPESGSAYILSPANMTQQAERFVWSAATYGGDVEIGYKLLMDVKGGDFTNARSIEKNCVLTKDGGKTFITPSIPPFGYRSCVEYLSKSKLITCGITGIDVSEDGGMNWRNISAEGFHVVRKAKKGKAVYLAGGKGRVAKLVW